jgi:hypothetical protein
MLINIIKISIRLLEREFTFPEKLIKKVFPKSLPKLLPV